MQHAAISGRSNSVTRRRYLASRPALLAAGLLVGSCGGGGGGDGGGSGGVGGGGGSSPTQPQSCPLTQQQTQQSVAAWAKISNVLTGEPRCVNCHGAVNPFIDGVGLDPKNSAAPASLIEHAGGKQVREEDPGTLLPSSTECVTCHDGVVNPTPPVIWTIPIHTFLGKDATTLCRQIKSTLPTATKFLAHMENDEGQTDFVATSFLGNRGIAGLDPEPPSITHDQFMQMSHDWVDAMGGQFQGDESCGCEVTHDGWSGQIHWAMQTSFNLVNPPHAATAQGFTQGTVTVADGVGTQHGSVTYNLSETFGGNPPDKHTYRASGDGTLTVKVTVVDGGQAGTYQIMVTQIDANGNEIHPLPVIGTSVDSRCGPLYVNYPDGCQTDTKGVLMPPPLGGEPAPQGFSMLDTTSIYKFTGTFDDPNHIHIHGSSGNTDSVGTPDAFDGQVVTTLSINWDLWRNPASKSSGSVLRSVALSKR